MYCNCEEPLVADSPNLLPALPFQTDQVQYSPNKQRREMNPYMDINITSLVTQAKKENSLNTSQLSSDLLEHRNSPLGKEGYGAGGV